jgi:hypothetical protein
MELFFCFFLCCLGFDIGVKKGRMACDRENGGLRLWRVSEAEVSCYYDEVEYVYEVIACQIVCCSARAKL